MARDFLSLAGICVVLVRLAASISIEPNSLRANGLVAPLDVSTLAPRLSWRTLSDIRGDTQTAYQVQVVSSPAAISSPDLWDTGMLSSSNVSTLYGGSALGSRSSGWWRVRVWDASGVVSDWSELTTFEVGLTQPADWSASWIANTEYQTGKNSLPVFAKPFNISCDVNKGRLHLIGFGQHSALVNGAPVTDAVLEPGYLNINRTLTYSTYDITSLLIGGLNVVGVELGKGIYDPEFALGERYMKFTTEPQQLKLLSQLEYTCADGTLNTVPSDTTWLTTTSGPLFESSWYGGEEYIAAQVLKDYSKPAGSRAGWSLATTTNGPTGTLTSRRSPPLKVVETLTAISATLVGQEWVFDFGVNFAGWFSLTVNGSGLAGSRIVFFPGEQLIPPGLPDQSTTGAPIFDGYTIAGEESETYTPKFMYHGFRYVQVNYTGTLQASDMKGLVIRTSNEPVGSLSTSNSLFNSIHQIIDRAIQSNMYSVMTDCPHREKLGWLEEDHLVLNPVVRGYDMQAASRDMTRTIADAQLPDGLVPDIAPEYVVFWGPFRDDPNWGSAMILMPYQFYQAYGDFELISDYYPQMQLYLNYLTGKATNFLLDYGLGDWVTFDTSTPIGVTATFGYERAAAGMATIATGLGKTEDAATYISLDANIKSSFHKTYFNTATNASYCVGGSQACNSIALDIGAVPADLQAAVLTTLVDTLTRDEYHLTVGEIALPSLFRALQKFGRNDVLFNIMSTTTNTSYGYQVVNGATSLWEHWDGLGGSLNHFMLGYADNWLMSLSGLAQSNTSIAWSDIEFRPIVVGDLTEAKSSYRTPRGIAAAEWSLSDGTLTYEVKVPVGTTAKVYLGSQQPVLESGQSLVEGQNGIASVGTNGNETVIGIGSGTYTFTSLP